VPGAEKEHELDVKKKNDRRQEAEGVGAGSYGYARRAREDASEFEARTSWRRRLVGTGRVVAGIEQRLNAALIRAAGSTAAGTMSDEVGA
jgi:hypothetical protein